MSPRTKDILIRAGKTFVQAFGGVVIPELVLYLNVGLPESWTALWAWLAPVICSGLAAAIAAGWNAIFLPSSDDKMWLE